MSEHTSTCGCVSCVAGYLRRIAELEEDLTQALDDHADTGKELNALRKQVRWIPVSERPIPEEEEVLMCHWYDAEKQMCWIASGSVENGVYFCGVMDKDFEPILFRTVTHWMPLPPPPQEQP